MPSQPMNEGYKDASGLNHHRETVGSGATSDPVIIHGDAERVSVAAFPGGGGTVTIQFTLSPPALVEAGTASWVAWSKGAVSSADADTLAGPVTAVRASAATAAGVFEIASR